MAFVEYLLLSAIAIIGVLMLSLALLLVGLTAAVFVATLKDMKRKKKQSSWYVVGFMISAIFAILSLNPMAIVGYVILVSMIYWAIEVSKQPVRKRKSK